MSCIQRQARLHGAHVPRWRNAELLKRQIDRLETAIELSTDWLEIQYLMAEPISSSSGDETGSEAA